ncbi:bifunctional ADP-heptose synthase [Bacteroidia bacterium]|jgi:rfaE bifunctional protein kinase chain/domain|nr:bifunctional ADP-heptose synthase [Bacteroidia bacterium]|tara:strand:+ start:132 stop:1121 length:990 start_codon:yes stop_codon:yes gene_type:complete
MNISRLFDQFEDTKVLVLGDVMIDAYFYGSVSRISPEAPVPIVNLTKKEQRLGGAANVALNLKSLGAVPIICSIKGNDADGQRLKELCRENGLVIEGLINDYKRETTVKTRIIGNSHQLLRIDEEDTADIDESVEDLVYEAVNSFIDQVDVLIFQDYNKGLLTAELIQRVIALCTSKKVPMVVDPKFNNFYEYKGVTLFKPNKKEIQQAENITDKLNLRDIKVLASTVRQKLNANKIMTTLSEDGVIIINETETIHLPAHARKILDVSGAGDSVLSVAALCVAAGISDEITAALSNLAGGIVCEQIGVVPIDKDLLLGEAMELNVANGY